MEQDEVIPNRLITPTGKKTRKMLEAKGIKEKPPLRYVTVRKGWQIGTNEKYVSDERDREIVQAYLEKRNNSIVKIF